MLRRGTAMAAAVSACLLSGVVWAQSAAATAQAGERQADARTGADTVPTFHANANLVLVDVVVRDKGKPVEGLQKSEFQVLEDGKPQAITVFEEHKATDAQEAAKAPALPPHVYGDFPQYRIISAANVLLLDALNTTWNDQKFVREQMLKVLHAIPAGTQIAVFTLGSRLRMISGFTTDAGAIEQALDLEHTPAQKGIVSDASEEVAEKTMEQSVTGRTPEMTRMAAEMMQESEDDRHAFEKDQRVDITLGAFGELARFLSTVPGRKNLIWVSGGLSAALNPDLSRMNANQAARFGGATRVVNAELTRARVAVYPVDARAEMNLTNSNPANVVAPTEHAGIGADLRAARNEGMENDIRTPEEWSESQQDMKLVATDTGGEAFYNTNAVGRALEQAIADGESYYTVGYAPPEGRKDGAYHTITVRLEERKYELAYRRGYYAMDASKPGQETPKLSPMLEAMEYGVPPLSQVIFEARVLAAGDPELHGLQPTPGAAGQPPQPLQAQVKRYFVDYAIDPRALELEDLPGGKRRAELEVTQVVYSLEGQRLNNTDAGLAVTLTPAQAVQPLENGGVRVRQEIDVPGEPVRVELGVRDATTGRIGTLEFELNGK